MSARQNIFRLSVSVLAISAMVPDAHAQLRSGAEAESADDTIIVTARRREESLQDVPLVVNAVSSETIEKLNLQDAKELQTLVPGLQLSSEGYAANGQIRGLQFDTNASTLPSVAFYLNDAPVNARAALSQLYDVGQVEVLRGPQGTLRGQASPSGSITFTTRKPDLTEVGGTLSFSGSNAHGGNVNGAINIPVVKDKLGIRLAGVWDRNRNNRVRTISPNGDRKHGYSEELGGRVSVLFTPTDWLRLEGVYQVIDYEDAAYAAYASYSLVDPSAAASPVLLRPKDRRSIQETASTNAQKFDIYNWRGELRFAGQKLIYQGARTEFKSSGLANQDSANLLTDQDIFQLTEVSSTQTSHEIRLQNEELVAGIFDYVVGYFNTKSPSNIHLVVETPVLLPPFLGGSVVAVAQTPIDSISDGPAKETSFFGNIIAHIGDRLQVSGGLRHVDYSEFPSFLQIGANRIPSSQGVDDKKWIYTASIQYQINPDLMVYANTGTSRRRGPTIFQSALLQSPLQRSFTQIESEDSTSYEVGFKSSWLDNRLIFNLTGFYQEFDNYTYKLANPIYYVDYDFLGGSFVPKVGSSFQWAAGVPVEIKGVEAELDFRPVDGLTFNLVAAYADGKVKNGLIPCNDLNGDNVSDTLNAAPTVAQLQAAYGADQIGSCNATFRSSNQSPFSATVRAEYRTPVSSGAEVFARGLFSYYGSSKNDPTLTFDDIGSYGLLNLFVGMGDPDGGWELTFYGRNVFNTAKYTRFGTPASTSFQELAPPTFQTTVGKAFTSTYSQIDLTPPREFGINLRLAFGSR